MNALRWLMDHQTAESGCFRPIGSNGFWRRGGERALFDQQPIEAAAAVSACIEAYHATGEPSWKERATSAFEWFLGANDLRLPVYDAGTGGCRDGIHDNRVNQNMGAESTLSYLLALGEIHALRTHSAHQVTTAP